MTITVGHAIVVSLILTRLLAMILIAPIFGAKVVPLRFRIALAATMSLVIVPVFIETKLPSEISAIQLAALFMSEVAIGLLFGLSLRLIFVAVDITGQQLAGLSGTQFPGVSDGIAGESAPPIAKLYGMICIMIFLTMGGHRRVVTGLLDSFHQSPPGVDYLANDFLPLVTAMISESFEFGVRLGAPFVVSSLLALLVLGIASRGLPNFNLMQSSFTINSLITLVIMLVTVGGAEMLMLSYYDQVNVWINQLFIEQSSIAQSAA